MSRTKASMINSSVRNSLISPEASWQRLCLVTECRAGERRPNRERESCINSQQKETRKPFFPPYKKEKKKNNWSCKEQLHLFCCWRFIFIISCWGSWQQARTRQREELEWAMNPWGLFGAAKGAAQRESLHGGQSRWWCGGQGWVLVYSVKHPDMHTYGGQKTKNLPCRSNFETVAVGLCQSLTKESKGKSFPTFIRKHEVVTIWGKKTGELRAARRDLSSVWTQS